MFFNKDNSPDTEESDRKSSQNEYVERVSRMLLVCVEGIQKIIEQTEPIFKKLNDLKVVIKQAVRLKPPALDVA